jgi:gp45 sliding clamp, C terminal
MKISQNTLSILKNFSSINQSILIKTGNVIKTISGSRTVFARAEIDEVFPKEFAIYELPKVLGAITLFKDPDFEFFDDHLKITEGKNYVRYTYADPSLIVVPPASELVVPSKDIYFELSEEDLNSARKGAGILGVEFISFVGEDGTIYVKANNQKSKSSDSFSVAVGVTDKTFNMIFKADDLSKFISGNYKITVSAKGITEFSSDKITYWLASDKSSTFGI